MIVPQDRQPITLDLGMTALQCSPPECILLSSIIVVLRILEVPYNGDYRGSTIRTWSGTDRVINFITQSTYSSCTCQY
jgi:hypothetical protein